MDYKFKFVFFRETVAIPFYEEYLLSIGDDSVDQILHNFIDSEKLTRNSSYDANGCMLSIETSLTTEGFNQWMRNEHLNIHRYKRDEYNTNNNILTLRAQLTRISDNQDLLMPIIPYKLLGSKNSVAELEPNYTGNLGDAFSIIEDNEVYKWKGQWRDMPIVSAPTPYIELPSSESNGWSGVWQISIS